jgi:tight adherence protein B
VVLTVAPPSELAGEEVPADAFGLTENGQEREARVTPLGSSELAVVVVMDTSGSREGGPIVASKAAALSFVNRLPDETNVAVIGFSDTPTVVSPFTTDRDEIATAIDSLSAGGETALYDGMLSAINLLSAATPDQRAIVLLSDGGDTVSGAPIEQVVDRVAASSAGVTAIELTTGGSDRTALDRITEAATGRVVAVDDPEALNTTYASIADRLSNLYEMRFTSSGATRADLAVSVDYQGVSSTTVVPVEFPDDPQNPSDPTPVEVAAAEPFVESGTAVPGNTLLFVGAFLVLLGLGAVLVLTIGDRNPTRRLAEEYDDAGVGEDGMAWYAALASQASDVGAKLASRGGQTVTIDNRLDAAGLSMRAGELIAFVAAASVGLAMFGFLVFGVLGFLIGLIAPALLTPLVLSAMRDRRQAKFGDQLGDTLVLLSSSLRAGYGLLQAIDAVARESDAPMSTEFGRVVTETRLGRDLNDALNDVAQRMGSSDFEWVVEAMQIHRDVGGDLTEVLDHVGETIRARIRIHRQVSALSAEGKISAIVLLILPFGVGLFVAISSPDYISALFDTTAGNNMLLVSLALLVVGGLWLRKIVRPEF